MSSFTTHPPLPVGQGCADTALGASYVAFLNVLVGVINARLERERRQRVERARRDRPGEYDFVVVGGGTAGCVLAARLSQEPAVSVLLLERGGTEPPQARVPAFASYVVRANMAEFMTSTAEPQSCNATGCSFPVPYVLGGGSSINGMMFIRGSSVDYDDWAKATGDSGWNSTNMLALYKRAESNQDPAIAQDTDYHSQVGPQPVSWQRFRHPSLQVLSQAMEATGLPFRLDVNGESQLGHSFVQTSTKDGERWSTYRSYLLPALGRPNLHVETFAKATRVLFEHRYKGKPTAVGVEYTDAAGQVHTARARKEVVLTAGTLHTPQILQLSGIGLASELQKLNVTQLVELPVGEQLEDHARAAGLEFSCGPPLCVVDAASRRRDLALYRRSRRGPLAEGQALQYGAFLRTNLDPPAPAGAGPPAKQPDLQILFLGALDMDNGARCLDNDAWRWNRVKWMPAVLHPRSRGRVRLNASDPLGQPIVEFGYLSDEGNHDLAVMVEGLRMGVVRQDTLAKLGLTINKDPKLSPSCSHLLFGSDEHLACLARTTTATLWHWTGTCRMGREGDETAVVDPKLRVKGVLGLRVADASVMPSVPSGNTNAPTIMVAERAATLILSDHGLPRDD
ncbi:glucose dehydrogenase [FAD, quinone]-like isoform X1 [Frankliniella occidentalis]|uniref:Glucose dehydrogenase [FAD, quinone]-like isoform X1 n=1 Tax=Frankliniella occidentalis TaxID=133901 RepID=A0A9C6X6R0_FRAOC|nr:glucose dehydrogenase [FAD, quinone]-like isoform X1 [Frankliniella occidentalis]